MHVSRSAKGDVIRAVAPWGSDLRRDMERFFDRFVDSVWSRRNPVGDWALHVIATQTKETMIVKTEVAGADPRDIEIGSRAISSP
jgi:HSP20 family molecular chaperone IbpA